MASISLVRIDNKLVHSQVTLQWNSQLQCSRILVANRELAANKLRQGLMTMTGGAGVNVDFVNPEEAVAFFRKLDVSEKVMILVANPQDALLLLQGGLPAKKINVGNLPQGPGRDRVASFVCVDEKDRTAFRAIRDLGVELQIQQVPSTKVEDNRGLFEE